MLTSNTRNQYPVVTSEKAGHVFSQHGHTLLSDVYTNCYTKMPFQCKCGNISEMSYSVARRGATCKKCASTKGGSVRRLSENDIKTACSDNGYLYISSRRDGFKLYVSYVCRCGKSAEKLFNNFKKEKSCASCKPNKYKGSNNHNWNPNLTDDDRQEIGRYDEGYNKWRRAVYLKDGFKCVCCKSDKRGTFVAHHLDGYANFPEKRTDVDNGVTLCVSCHKDFHRQFGYGLNTSEQFNTFLEKGE
jgi:hypothetical protein